MKKYIVSIIFMMLVVVGRALPYVVGDITITGGASYNGPLGTATKVTAFNNPVVQSVDGDLATTVNAGDFVLFATPFVFGTSTPYPTLYSVGGWNFELFSSSVDFQNTNFLAISGTGEFTGNGFLPTLGEFYYTSQGPRANGIYSFSASGGSLAVNDNLGSLAAISAGVLLLTIKRFT